jgi:hypothetical protein
MKNILNPTTKDEIITRIDLLHENDKPLWGKMSAGDFLCHISDSFRMATGQKEVKFTGNAFSTSLMKMLILNGLPIPKGKIETSPELKPGKRGTPTTDFSNDKNTLIDLINGFEENYPENQIIVHPAFGKMNRTQWGKLMFIHTNHHLKQFGK